VFHGDAHVEILTGIGYGFQLLIRRLHVLVAKARARLSYGIRCGLREDARGMEGHRGVQEVRLERVDLFGKQLRDVRVPQLFPHHRAVLGSCQGMIVGLPGAGLVTSIRSFSSSMATWSLLYAEPFSAWNPTMINGNPSSC
jgi:hypothetical protein